MKTGLKLLCHLLLWLGLPLLLLALLLSLLLFTRPGVRLAADVAMGALPQLRIEDLDGTIAHGLRASRVLWRDGSGVQYRTCVRANPQRGHIFQPALRRRIRVQAAERSRICPLDQAAA